jgi:hypothetical protein
MMKMPTVGRIVHFFDVLSDGTPLAAIVVAVVSDRLVNLVVWDEFGQEDSECDVIFCQSDEVVGEDDAYATWPERV